MTFTVNNPKWPSKAKRTTPHESAEARWFVQWADRRFWGTHLAHVQNEQASGRRVTGAIKKGEGVRSGYPDYLLDLPSWGWHGLRIELKRVAGSTFPEKQKQWQLRLLESGYLSVVAPGHRIAMAWCEWYAHAYGLGMVLRDSVFALPTSLPGPPFGRQTPNHHLFDMAEPDGLCLDLAPARDA